MDYTCRKITLNISAIHFLFANIQKKIEIESFERKKMLTSPKLTLRKASQAFFFGFECEGIQKKTVSLHSVHEARSLREPEGICGREEALYAAPLCGSRLHGAHDVFGDDGDRGPPSALRAGGGK